MGECGIIFGPMVAWAEKFKAQAQKNIQNSRIASHYNHIALGTNGYMKTLTSGRIVSHAHERNRTLIYKVDELL